MAMPIKREVVVQSIVQHDHDVYQVTLTSTEKIPNFKPGQFLHLALDAYDPCTGMWPESRVFSIASSLNNNSISIIYSVKGNYTQRLARELEVGKKMWIKLPYGSFTITTPHPQQDVILLAGGTGIAPYIPYLEQELICPSGRKITLAYGIRGEHCYLFKTLLHACTMIPHFELILFNGQPIDFEKIYTHAQSYSEPCFFISGPKAMIDSAYTFFSLQNIPPHNIRIDAWD